MTLQIQSLLRLLEAAGFEYPVAVCPGEDPELGRVLDADAFDVPEPRAVGVSTRLAEILWQAGFSPTTVLPGIVHDSESEAWRTRLPPETVWYQPHRSGRRRRSSGS
jgi:hypothetical protein